MNWIKYQLSGGLHPADAMEMYEKSGMQGLTRLRAPRHRGVIETMDACCTEKACALERLRERQAATLRVVLLVNAAMFIVEFVSGLLAGSVAVLADSLDMLGDALVYGFSLYVVARGAVWKARAAVAKATVMGLFGVFVLAQLLYKLAHLRVPTFEAMGAVGALALIANGFALRCCGVIGLRTSICGPSGSVRETISLRTPRCW